jgi:hypothetical protein
VRLDATQLAGDGPQDLAARGQLDAHQLLGRAVPGQFVVDRRAVVHAVDDRDVLVVIQVLAELFEPAVQVADVRRALGNPFAVEFEDNAQGRVGRGVLGAEVERPAVSAILAAGGLGGSSSSAGESV